MRPSRLTILALLALAACHGSPYKQAKEDMMDSKEAYKECLENNDGNVSKCEAQRINHETDVKALNTLK